MRLKLFFKDRIAFECILLFLGMCAIVLLSPNHPIGDEQIYLSNLDWKGYFFSSAFIQQYKGTSGILSTWLFSLFPAYVRAHIETMRLLFVVQFSVSVWLCFLLLKRKGFLLHPSIVIFIPGSLVLCARAMGDFPPVLLMTVFLWVIEFLEQKGNTYRKRGLIILVSALLGALTIIGKQNLSVVVFIWPFYLFVSKRMHWIELVLFYLILLPFPLYIFSLWQGIAPASSKIVSLGFFHWQNAEFVLNWFFLSYLFLKGDFKSWFRVQWKNLVVFITLTVCLYFAQDNWRTDLAAHDLRSLFHLIFHLELAMASVAALQIMKDELLYSFSWQQLSITIIILLMALASVKLSAMQMRYPAAFFPFLLLYVFNTKTALVKIKYWSLLGLAFNLLNIYLLYQLS
jgi:hypothetical protein